LSNRPIVTDPLTDLLARARVRAGELTRLELRAAGRHEVAKPAHFTVITAIRGAFRVELVRARPLSLDAGDVAILLRPSVHTLVAPRNSGAATAVIGTMSSESHGTCSVAEGLPPALFVSAERRAQLPALSTTVEQLVAETGAQAHPGAALVAARLLEVLFVHVLRAELSSPAHCPTHGWIAATVDPHVGVALKRMRDELAEPWTVASLARVAGQSRSVFAARFQALTGVGPLAHLTALRVHEAERLLREEQDLSVDDVAARVGYGSGAAFAKAFKRETRVSPGRYRRRRA
jgi:AraC-like DNA-binding protein